MTLKKKAIMSSETRVTIYQNSQFHMLKESKFHAKSGETEVSLEGKLKLKANCKYLSVLKYEKRERDKISRWLYGLKNK